MGLSPVPINRGHFTSRQGHRDGWLDRGRLQKQGRTTASDALVKHLPLLGAVNVVAVKLAHVIVLVAPVRHRHYSRIMRTAVADKAPRWLIRLTA